MELNSLQGASAVLSQQQSGLRVVRVRRNGCGYAAEKTSFFEGNAHENLYHDRRMKMLLQIPQMG